MPAGGHLLWRCFSLHTQSTPHPRLATPNLPLAPKNCLSCWKLETQLAPFVGELWSQSLGCFKIHLSASAESGDSLSSNYFPFPTKRNEIRVYHLGCYFIKSSEPQHNCPIFIIAIQFLQVAEKRGSKTRQVTFHQVQEHPTRVPAPTPSPGSKKRAAATAAPGCRSKYREESFSFRTGGLYAFFFSRRELTRLFIS